MRIDKYLWTVRYFKTRNQAAEACKKGHISINEAKVKPSKEVFTNDVIRVRKDQIVYHLEVLDFPKNRVGAKLVAIYCKDITSKEHLEHNELLRLAKSQYRNKGEGRPTKKNRRDIEGFTLD